MHYHLFLTISTRTLMMLDRSTRFAEDRLVSAPTNRLKFTGNGRCELDSHADTGCAGPDCYVEFLRDETVNVYPFLPEVDDYDADTADFYLNSNVVMPRGDGFERGKVVRRSQSPDLDPIGKAHKKNPILDMRLYEIQFEDGEVSTYQANMIRLSSMLLGIRSLMNLHSNGGLAQ